MPKDNSLIGLRAVGDPGADDIFHEAERQTGLSAMRALEALREPSTELPKELDELLDGWVRHGPELPSWADPKLIEAGQQFFNDWDLAICTSLFNASLPSAYAGAQGARVLSPVSQLAKRATVARRIGETGQLLLDITQPGALDRGGAGYRHVIQVRELHAAVRAVLLGRDAPGGAWPEADGVPINQEDLLATLLTFTVVVLRALDRMGIEVSAEEQEAYLHLWAVTGDNVFPAKVVGRRMIQHWIDQQSHGEGPSISITAEQSRRWHLTERDNFVAAKRRQLRARRQRRRQPRARVPRSNSPAPTR